MPENRCAGVTHNSDARQVDTSVAAKGMMRSWLKTLDSLTAVERAQVLAKFLQLLPKEHLADLANAAEQLSKEKSNSGAVIPSREEMGPSGVDQSGRLSKTLQVPKAVPGARQGISLSSSTVNVANSNSLVSGTPAPMGDKIKVGNTGHLAMSDAASVADKLVPKAVPGARQGISLSSSTVNVANSNSLVSGTPAPMGDKIKSAVTGHLGDERTRLINS